MKTFVLVSAWLIATAGCAKVTHEGDNERVSKLSPSGWCVARVLDSRETQNTSVLLDFDSGKCYAGAVHFKGTGIKIGLRWIADDTLEVRYPVGAVPEINASGGVIQCFSRRVRVVLTPENRGPNQALQRTPAAPPFRS